MRLVFLFLFFVLSSSANVSLAKPLSKNSETTFYQSGYASRYGTQHVGKKTAKGELYDPKLLTAASKTLPLGSIVKVEVVKTGRSVLVRINDRGPHVKKRVIDLSEIAAKKLGIYRQGVAKVNIYLVKL
jgi:rare lipoprotein A